jgi:hypothetical protein
MFYAMSEGAANGKTGTFKTRETMLSVTSSTCAFPLNISILVTDKHTRAHMYTHRQT